ncbi:MAG: M23 family metallopeptidase [Alphaproteobacteria bacterium]|nr:M23 family metallopeptidase [Alphaproteobacteria bacterium]MBR1649474.1 M23 family metallopeptidase [Alphaproteobacteria bacterium]
MLQQLIQQAFASFKTKQCWTAFGLAFVTSLLLIFALSLMFSTEEKYAAAEFLPQQAEFASNEVVENFDSPEITEPEDNHIHVVKISSGDTLLKVLTRVGLSYSEANKVFLATKKVFNPKDLRVGQKFEIETELTDNGLVVKSLDSTIRTGQYLHVALNDNDTYSAKLSKDELIEELKSVSGKVNGTLSLAMNRNGVPNRITANFISIFSQGVNFRRDLKKGDSYEIVYENYLTPDGKTVKHGNIVYAALNLGKNKMELYRFKDSTGHIDYYTPKGLTLKKNTLSRRPMAYQSNRISSYFGPRRHPIYKDKRVHWGVDYPAPKGSAIYAGGDGTVEVAQYKSGYGNYVRIRHNGEYSTAYGHMNGFAKGIRAGSKVKQGQVIGYVGSTGRSTGPHLHYEVIRNGKRVNPLTIKATASQNLQGKNLSNFKREMAKLNSTRQKMLAAKNKEEKLAQKPATKL